MRDDEVEYGLDGTSCMKEHDSMALTEGSENHEFYDISGRLGRRPSYER